VKSDDVAKIKAEIEVTIKVLFSAGVPVMKDERKCSKSAFRDNVDRF